MQILLNPGPVNVSPRVRRALAEAPDLCHREPEFTRVLRSIRERLVSCFGISEEFVAIVLTGSGTLAVEAMIASGVGAGKLLVIRNGVYGDRIAAMACAHRIPIVEVQCPWTEHPSLEEVERTLRVDPEIEAIAAVHHETTTGLINPIAALGALAHRYEKRFLVDSVSGLGGEEINLHGAGVDLCAGNANKCIQGFPGLSFVLVRRSRLAELCTPPRSLYLDLRTHLEAAERDSMPFTMAVQVAFALDEALAELQEETVPGRIARYRAAAAFLRDGFASLGLDFLLAPEKRANSLTALHLPPGLPYKQLHDDLAARGFVIYEGQGRLQTQIFRVANMGHLEQSHFAAFLDALREVLR